MNLETTVCSGNKLRALLGSRKQNEFAFNVFGRRFAEDMWARKLVALRIGAIFESQAEERTAQIWVFPNTILHLCIATTRVQDRYDSALFP